MLYRAKITRIIYKNDDCFYICEGVIDNTLRTFKGNIFFTNIKKNDIIYFEGSEVEDPKYGSQIQITYAPVIDYNLPSECMSPYTVVFNSEPDKLLSEVEIHQDYIKKYVDLSKIYKSLSRLGSHPLKIVYLWDKYGTDLPKLLLENPWLLYDAGVAASAVDEFVKEFFKEGVNFEERIKFLIKILLEKSYTEGYLCLPLQEVISSVAKEQKFENQNFSNALISLHKEKKIVLDKTITKNTLVYSHDNFIYESKSSEILLEKLNSNDFSGFNDSLENILEDVEEFITESSINKKINLSEKQKEAIYNAIKFPVTILTGLPGTGKTTTLKLLTNILKELKVKFTLLAPTGIAAKRIQQVTDCEAFTIHRAFGAKGGDDSESLMPSYSGVLRKQKYLKPSKSSDWEDYEHNFPSDFIIVDECSMVDQSMLYRILKSTKIGSKILFIGDPEQLSSVGAGSVLNHLIASEKFPVVFLNEIFRQENTSGIVKLAHDIYHNRVDWELSVYSDFEFVEHHNHKNAVDHIISLAEQLYGAGNNFQIMSPTYKGDLGVSNLNNKLRDKLNPKSQNKEEIKLGEWLVRKGDRVMIIKNSYDKNVYNGDIGKIKSVNFKSKELVVKIFETVPRYVTFSFNEILKYLRMAYACTIHKSQGQEYDIVVIPLTKEFRNQLHKNLIYTGITRAKKKVILVGDVDAFGIGVSTKESEKINKTFFLQRLKSNG